MPEHNISHDGIIDSLEGNDVVVRITSFAACSECHARGACNVTEIKEKYMRVRTPHEGFSIGENVRVVLSKSLGFRALFLGYVLPFILVLFVLLICTAAGCRELLAGLLSLAVLLPYYLVLKAFRGRLEQRFSFDLQKN